jgi:hypothetical protein
VARSAPKSKQGSSLAAMAAGLDTRKRAVQGEAKGVGASLLRDVTAKVEKASADQQRGVERGSQKAAQERGAASADKNVARASESADQKRGVERSSQKAVQERGAASADQKSVARAPESAGARGSAKVDLKPVERTPVAVDQKRSIERDRKSTR